MGCHQSREFFFPVSVVNAATKFIRSIYFVFCFHHLDICGREEDVVPTVLVDARFSDL